MNWLYKLFSILLLFSSCLSAQEKTQLKIMSYNLRFGELASLEQLGNFIKSENPDIVLLQEVDIYTNRERALHQNGKNFIAELGYYTNMMSLFGKSITYEGGYYGLGILSKYPFIQTERFLLPLVEEKREQRSLLTALLELDNGQQITVACTHLDLKPEIRIEQVAAINNLLKNKTTPILLAGDFNAKPDSPEIAEGMKGWQHSCKNDVFTIPAKAPKSKIDYIFSYPEKQWKLINSYVPEVTLSDHRPVVATLELIK